MSSKPFIVASAVLLVMGVVMLVFTATVVRFMAHDDVYVLTTRYNPHGDANYEPYRTYAKLYGRTEQLVHQRNHYGLRFHYAVGLSFIAMGVLLVTWAVDRHRLHRRIRELESREDGA